MKDTIHGKNFYKNRNRKRNKRSKAFQRLFAADSNDESEIICLKEIKTIIKNILIIKNIRY